MFCSKCGAKIEEGTKFCSGCGSAVNTEVLETKVENTEATQTLYGVDPARYDMPKPTNDTNLQGMQGVPNMNVQGSNMVEPEMPNPANNTNLSGMQSVLNMNNQSSDGYVHNSSIRKAIKKDAKSKPKGTMIIGMIITYVIMFGVSFTLNSTVAVNVGDYTYATLPVWASIVNLVVSCICGIVSCFGVTGVALAISRGKTATTKDLFVKPFNKIGKIALSYLAIFGLMVAFIICLLIPFVNMLLPLALIVASIYFTPTFDMIVTMIMDDEKENLSFSEIVKSAIEITKGHRVEYYGMVFSFFGWMILGIFTFGILYIWLVPYMRISIMNMYRRWLGEANFTTPETGLSNGAVIGVAAGSYFGCIIVIIISIVAFISAGVVTTLGIGEIVKNSEKYQTNEITTTKTVKNNGEATLKNSKLKITFNVPKGFEASKYNTNYTQSFEKKTSDTTQRISYGISYIYGDYYKTKVDSLKSIYSTDRYTVSADEYTVSVDGNEVKCFTLKASTQYYSSINTYAFYPIDEDYYVLIDISNIDVNKDNIKKYIDVK